MAKDAKDVFVVAMSTVGSRFMGLLRDVLLVSFLGTGAVTSAFLLAFTLPNLFRRLLGEGALTSAVIPVFTDDLEHGGSRGLRRSFNQSFTWLSIVLLFLVLLGMFVFFGIRYIPNLTERWYTGARLSIVVFPYMFFICLAALFTAVLNVKQHFAVPAMSQVWLNSSMILAMLLPSFWGIEDSLVRVYWLCGGVLFGGLLQALLPMVILKRMQLVPQVSFERSESLRRIWLLFLPGVWGAAIFQINTVVSRLLAFSVDDQAVSILYIANRLIELPLGVFAIAVSTVLFPKLARYVTRNDYDGFGRDWLIGAKSVLTITVPAAVGLIVLGQPILQFLFAWGAFNQSDVDATWIPLSFFALALPFYSVSGLIVRAFHSFKDMQTPVRIAGYNFLINLGLSLCLMYPFGMNGLAAANASSGIVYCLLLFMALRRKPEFCLPSEGSFKAVLTLVFAAFVMGGVGVLLMDLAPMLQLNLKLESTLLVVAGIPFCVAVYVICLWLLRFKDLETVKNMLLGVIQKKKKQA
jgi:putative peptidoglycan lipid II flippase